MPFVPFRNGKRVGIKHDDPYAGQTLAKFLKGLGPRANPKWSDDTMTGFQVSLPGDEKRVPKDDCALIGRQITITIEHGKVTHCVLSNHK